MKSVVIGTCHHNTLGVLRSLGEKGIQSHLILVGTEKNPYIKHSKYIDSYTQVPDFQQIVPVLLAGSAKGVKSVIISCADPVTSILDLNKDALSPYYHLPVGRKQGDITEIMDKNNMQRVALKVGIKIPKTLLYSSVKGNDYWPLIIKPIASIKGSKQDIKIVRNYKEYSDYLESNISPENLQIQHFIEKETEFQLIGCSLNAGEKVLIPGASIILRQPKNTNTGYLRYVPFSEFSENGLIAKCKSFIHEIGYSGLFSMEFLRDKNGVDYFMEINMRNDGNSICVTASGINLPYIWYANADNNCITEEVNKQVHTVYVMPEFEDFTLVLKTRSISIFQWLKDVRNVDRFMEYSKDDIKPFIVGLYQFIIKKITRIIHK